MYTYVKKDKERRKYDIFLSQGHLCHETFWRVKNAPKPFWMNAEHQADSVKDFTLDYACCKYVTFFPEYIDIRVRAEQMS